MSNRVYSKPVDAFKMLSTEGLTGADLISAQRFNGARKIVNLRGGIDKAVRAYNRQATRKITSQTFVRYMSSGSSGDHVIAFVLNDY